MANQTLDELKLVAKYRILDNYQNLLLNLKYLWIYGQAWEEKMVKKILLLEMFELNRQLVNQVTKCIKNWHMKLWTKPNITSKLD